MPGADVRYPRALRLLAPAQYQRVFRHCEVKSSDRYLTVLACSNAFAHPRLGTTVSIRNAGNAVKRNRIKRLIKESFRLNQQQLTGWDLVVVARAGVSSKTNRQLFNTLETHWRKIAAHAKTGTDTD